ncbi:MAG TPA: CusA/CzcA family heavy metal efflux RND transporter [Phycisphaerales bacterium]|nr:CusA/CzcA family heavy metal efflux RND transporter [Phycisphaerales bacterium]
MLERIISISIEHRWVVVLISLLVAALGVNSARRLDIDAFPDTTPVLVQVNATAPALGALETEQQVTLPLEQAIAGLPALTEVRSISKFGLSQVTAIFEDGTSIHLARQLVSERLSAVELPDGIGKPELGPISTGLGEIFHYIVHSPDGSRSLEELTTIHDWMIAPKLLSVRGVAEVNTWGGRVRQYQVLVDPDRLIQRGMTMDEIIEALHRNNMNVGGGSLTSGGEQQIVQGIALTASVQEIADIVIAAHEGTPIRVRDVGEVTIGHEIRRGAATFAGAGEAVLGLGFMLTGENSHDVAARLARRLEELKPGLPDGVEARIVYQRTELVDQVISTVKENLGLGAILVIAVLFAFLGNLRAGLIVAMAIPLSMLFAANMMLANGIAASLMSLGAIDFGLVVDSSVIMVENSVRRLGDGDDKRSRLEIVRDAALEVRRPTMFGELIIMVVYLPILTLEGIEGKLFKPMALTVVFALLGSLVLSLTLMPALAAIMLPHRAAGHERENVLVRIAQWIYAPIVRFAIRARQAVIVFAIVLLAVGALAASRLGAEFIPRLSEGALSFNLVRLAGVSLDESVRYGDDLERLLLSEFPDEIRDIWTRVGSAAVATDPMGIELSDMFVMLHPRDQWKRATTQDQLAEAMSATLNRMPGMRVVGSQPIEMRINEMIAGIRADLGVKIFGDDPEVLRAQAQLVVTILESIPGAADVAAEQVTGQPMLEVVVDQDAIARHGIPAETVMQMVEAIGGIPAGEIREGQRRFGLAIRLDEAHRRSPTAIADITVPTPSGGRLPLSTLAQIREVEGPSTITREWQQRRIVVQCNVTGRDLGSFVAEAQGRIAADLALPAGYFVMYGGQYEHLQQANARLLFIVPVALALIMILLYLSLHSMRDALIVFTGAPFAALGGIAVLMLRGMPFTIAAGIGFIAVSGVAMLNGLVLVATFNQLRERGLGLEEAIDQTRLLRLRPILMTALVAALGFVPMALNTHVGAEVQRPLASVVIGGMITNTVLTLVVMPALLATFRRERTNEPA